MKLYDLGLAKLFFDLSTVLVDNISKTVEDIKNERNNELVKF